MTAKPCSQKSDLLSVTELISLLAQMEQDWEQVETASELLPTNVGPWTIHPDYLNVLQELEIRKQSVTLPDHNQQQEAA